MSLTLPPVGTSQLLELVSPYAPDDFIAEVCPRHFTGGGRGALSAPPLWCPHLLAGLVATHHHHLVGRLLRRTGLQPHAVALMDATDLPAACSGFKKNSGHYTAAHAALGGRTLKTGQSRWFVGYKKHTLRVWLPTRHPSVTLVPLVSWLTPGNVAEGGLLRPSLHWCRRHWGWWPGIVVADLGYLSAPEK